MRLDPAVKLYRREKAKRAPSERKKARELARLWAKILEDSRTETKRRGGRPRKGAMPRFA